MNNFDNNYVKKTDYDTKIGSLELKILDVSVKLNISDFNNKVTELEDEIKTAKNNPDISNLANKNELDGYVKKSDYANEITKIKNDYVTQTALTSQLNDLKNQHCLGEVTKLETKINKNSSDILSSKSSIDIIKT